MAGRTGKLTLSDDATNTITLGSRMAALPITEHPKEILDALRSQWTARTSRESRPHAARILEPISEGRLRQPDARVRFPATVFSFFQQSVMVGVASSWGGGVKPCSGTWGGELEQGFLVPTQPSWTTWLQ